MDFMVEKELHQKMIDARLEYLKYMRTKLIPLFEETTKNFVWNREHVMYKYYFPPAEEKKRPEISDIKKIYKELALVTHPDKCKKDGAEDNFAYIQSLYDNGNVEELQKLYDSYIRTGQIEIPDAKESEIRRIESEIWYQWYLANNICLKQMFHAP